LSSLNTPEYAKATQYNVNGSMQSFIMLAIVLGQKGFDIDNWALIIDLESVQIE